VLIIISDNENDDDADEGEHVARLRQIALTSLLMRAVVIDLNL